MPVSNTYTTCDTSQPPVIEYPTVSHLVSRPFESSPMNHAQKLLAIFASLLFFDGTAVANDKVIDLLAGNSLDNWTTQAGKPITRGWVAENGMLVRKGRGGAIYTKDEYGDFELRFQWKIGKGGNSGIKYRMAFYQKGVRGRPGWLGCEYQIYGDRRPGDRGTHSAGALYDLIAPNENKRLRPADEFNDSRIVVQGTRIEHWLNGEKVVDVDTGSNDWKQRIGRSKFGIVPDFFKNARGRIQIQDHGHPVWYRNIQLRLLDGIAETAARE